LGPDTTPGSITATILSQPAHRDLFGKLKPPILDAEWLLKEETGLGAWLLWDEAGLVVCFGAGGSGLGKGTKDMGRCLVIIFGLGNGAH
jgi:hypothetical protein